MLVALSAVAAVIGGCAAQRSPRLAYATIDSPAMQSEMEYAVFVPEHAPDESLPLVVFLHGGGDDPSCFDEYGVGEALDAAMKAGTVPKAVIVVPQGDFGFWENWKDGSRLYRDWVVKDLMPEIQERYGTQGCPEGCHVMGISMGGHGAVRFALGAGDSFSSVTVISAPIFDSEEMQGIADSFWLNLLLPVDRIWGDGTDRAEIESQDVYLVWTKPGGLGGRRLLLAWGTEDSEGIQEANQKLVDGLQAAGIPHEVIVFDGGHDWDGWQPTLEQALAIQVGANATGTDAVALQ